MSAAEEKRSMKIILLCNEYPTVRAHAGIGTVVQILARGLSRRGHDVTVIGMGDTASESWDGGVRLRTYIRCKWNYVGNLISRMRLRRRLIELVKQDHVDIVEVPDSQGLLPVPISHCATVVRLHLSFTGVTHVTGEKHGRGLAFFERRTVASNSNWIGVSSYVMNLTQKAFGVAPKRSAVVYNPAVALPEGPLETPDLPRDFILYAGHVSSRKGADVLAKAFAEIADRYPDLHLIYVGGIYSDNGIPISDRITEELGPARSQRVRFLGASTGGKSWHVRREPSSSLFRPGSKGSRWSSWKR